MTDHVEIDKLSLGPGFEVDYRPGISKEDLLKLVGGYEALIVRSRTKVDKTILEQAQRLRLVARAGTGLDNVDVESAKSRGVQVVNSPESLVEAVAEHVTLLMLALSRKLVPAASSTSSGRWEKESFMGVELWGKTLGIVGLGRIGKRIGEIAHVMGMRILVYDVITIPPEVISALDCKVVRLDELLSEADYVTLHVPLTGQTRHMLDSGRLSSMKKTAYLINTSRGGVIEEAALVNALRRNVIAGAGLDVFEKEPPTGEILNAPNVILTPHIAGQTADAQTDAIKVIGDKVKAFFSRG